MVFFVFPRENKNWGYALTICRNDTTHCDEFSALSRRYLAQLFHPFACNYLWNFVNSGNSRFIQVQNLTSSHVQFTVSFLEQVEERINVVPIKGCCSRQGCCLWLANAQSWVTSHERHLPLLSSHSIFIPR